MEADRATSHVEFLPKLVKRLEVRIGRYWVEQAGNALQLRFLSPYYFGHLLKSNFFLASCIEIALFC
jgi:hypothetical protein